LHRIVFAHGIRTANGSFHQYRFALTALINVDASRVILRVELNILLTKWLNMKN